MDTYAVLWVLLITLGIVALIASPILVVMYKKQTTLLTISHQNQMYFLERTIAKRDQTIQNLMDRLTSPDMHSYRVMTSVTEKMTSDSTQSFNPAGHTYVSMSDEAEADRLVQMSGFGEPVYDQETLMFNADMMGLDIVHDTIGKGRE